MKYLKKIFENKSELEKDVRDIFHDYIFDEEPASDVEYAGECWSGEDKPHVVVSIYGPQKKNLNVTDIEEFDKFILETQKQVEFLKKMRSLCYRLKSWDYEFDFNFNQEENEYYIKVYEPSTDFNLIDAFDAMGYGANDHILKRVLKNKYNLVLYKTEFHNSNGRNPKHIILSLGTPIDMDHQLIKDLSSLTKKGKTGPHNLLFRSVRPYHASTDGKLASLKLEYLLF